MENIFGDHTKKLGFGLMRLPQADPNEWGTIDFETTNKMVDAFLAQGFTYFDTAWMYCGFNSESAVKTCLTSRYPRERFTLATKLHGGFFDTPEGMDDIFRQQLEKTGAGYFDYYLLHDIGEDHYKKYTELGSFEWLIDKKKSGLVKHIGFSYHDRAQLLDRVLTEHPEMEFVQLQINYLDWESEAIQSRLCYEVCMKHDKPVVVMEPVRGGTLSNNVPSAVEELFHSYNPDASLASWAIRFAASHPGVKMVLSGMGNMEMMMDNTSYMKEFIPLNEEELKLVFEAAELINANLAIPCTGCAYCVDGCPMNIPIPKYFSLFNAEKQEYANKGFTPQGGYYNRLGHNFGKASACVECGQCEEVCPQHLPIRDHLKEVAALFE